MKIELEGSHLDYFFIYKMRGSDQRIFIVFLFLNIALAPFFLFCLLLNPQPTDFANK